jgi:peptidoglycan/xylan/chitin deacetylase (PgdA/CDA1 family)
MSIRGDINNPAGAFLADRLDLVYLQLAAYAGDAAFSKTVLESFGADVDASLAAAELRSLQSEGARPAARVVDGNALNGNHAAFDAASNTILVSADFLAANFETPANVDRVLIEEIGHYIDTRVHAFDAKGDEGEIFASHVAGGGIDAAKLAALQAQNDHGTILVDGRMTQVEFAGTYGTITVDGSVADWAAGERLDNNPGGVSGYQLFAKHTGDTMVFAITAPVAIGANTTVWLNTDLNRGSGYQIWGFAGGAEYNINFDASGTPRLYTGADGQTLVNGALDFSRSADGRTVEIALPTNLIGGATGAEIFADVNNSVFIPNDYSNFSYRIAAPVVNPPAAPVVGSVTLDGSLADWTAAERIDTSLGTSGYEIYGKTSGDSYIVAMKAPIAIGANTTAWLNTDKNAATGFQIFGFAGGAEFNVNFDASGNPSLYTGDAGQTLVSAGLLHGASANNTIVEFAIPKALIGSPQAINTLYDVNNAVYLPSSYSAAQYEIRDAGNLPPRTDFTKKVGIVYSETTANNFFDKTAYSQLFMNAQSQAAMAGVPFDILTEADLTNLAKLANYDTLVFPSFRNVPAAQAAAIENTLTLLTQQYKVGLIAAGDFMTNDATGAALPGDSYARMKTLFDLTRVDGGTSNIQVAAGDTTHAAMQGYNVGEQIRAYTNTGYSVFGDATPGVTAPTVLATETVSTGTFGAVLANQNNGRNVHFATESFLADNNMLWQAIQWSANGSGITVGLQMGRQASVVAARNDMDQSQETNDVNPNAGLGIYDKLLPILQDWKAAYNFVGSYYINVGNNAPDQVTDWSVSAPYYQQILAMGNEIGTHSYTHPDNTNLLTAAQIAFEFNQSQLVIEQQLGINVVGAAVPGAPEKLPASLGMIQYFDYLSGGASAVGAGYPGAFGYITPAVGDKIYLAPNMSFDFTLVGFQGKTAEQAAAAWALEFTNLTKHGDVPVVLWPWHDYGPTQWVTDPPAASKYTLQMYTSFIQQAYNSGAEFVTLADLAQRIESFEKAGVTFSVAGSTVTATVTSPDAGKFALDLDGLGTQVIKSVAGWYAYDNDSVFTDRDGGTFTIATGAAADDVTHITQLAARSELISLTGDGTNLNFVVNGEGKVAIDLTALNGRAVNVAGATISSLVGDKLVVDLGAIGQHAVSVTYGAAVAAPVITSNGGGAAAAVSFTENATTAVTKVVATNPTPATPLAFALAGGADASLFNINAATGDLTFKAAPDFETPKDAGANNIYDVIVSAIGAGGAHDDQALAITIANVLGLTLNGTSAANTLTGAGEEDTLNGLGGNDTLSGLGGNDILSGGAGLDIILGGDGNDRLIGGASRDTMTGGLGADVFALLARGDTAGSSTGRDIIADFSTIDDKIDLSAIDANIASAATGNQAFVFLPNAGQAMTAPGQVHYSYTNIGGVQHTIVEFNVGTVNGSIGTLFQIDLVGQHALTADDFIL